MRSAGDVFISMLGWFALTIILVCYGGWLLELFWAWFAVPVFRNLPKLTLGQAVGLRALIGLLVPQNLARTEQDNLTVIASGVGVLTLLLFMGWVTHLVIGGTP